MINGGSEGWVLAWLGESQPGGSLWLPPVLADDMGKRYFPPVDVIAIHLIILDF